MNMILSNIHSCYRGIQRGYPNIYSKRTQFLFENIKSNSNILILGARDNFIQRIVGHTNNKLTYYLVDKNPPESTKTNFVYSDSDLNENIPFPDNYFECIVSDQLIEHLSKPDCLIKEIKRVGKKGCTVIIGSENLAAWHNIIALILTLHPFSDHYSEHIRIGNPLSIHNSTFEIGQNL